MRILSDSVLPLATLAATSTAASSLVTNLNNGNLFDYWQPAATGLQTITITFAAPTTVDAIGVAGHNIFSAGITSITVRLYDSLAALLSTNVINVTSDKIILKTLTEGTAASAQIDINVVSTLPRISSIYIGKSIYTTRSPEFGAELPYLDNQKKVSALKNQVGVVMGSVTTVPQGIKLPLSLDHLSLTWVQASWIPFTATAMEVPFFISLSDIIPDPIYALADSINNPTFTGPDRAGVRLQIEGVLE